MGDQVLDVDSKACQNCGRILRSGWKFCPDCKLKISQYACINCQQELQINWSFCPNCRTILNVEAQKSDDLYEISNNWLIEVLKH